MTILSVLVLIGALGLAWLARQLGRALWQSQVRLARLEQGLVDLLADRRYRQR